MNCQFTSRASVAAVIAALVLVVPTRAHAEDPGWPREIQLQDHRIVVYQPQPESFSGHDLSARAAVSIASNGAAPVFGAVWMTARVETDRDTRLVVVTDVSIDRVRFPDASEEQQTQISTLLSREMTNWELEMSLDRLTASLEDIGAGASTEGLNFDPPDIVVRDHPAVLVMIDGSPELQAMEGTDFTRVVNTPFLIVKSDRYYLFAGTDAWYVAAEVMGPWTFTERVPSDIAALAPDDAEMQAAEQDDDSDEEGSGAIPEIVVATAPTELIFSDGEPAYTPIGTGELMYVSNTDSTVILDVQSQRHFILISGRWYSATSGAGPWTYHPSDELPAGFKAIEEQSEIADVRVHVAGTDEANDAVLDAMIPQTAEVQRGPADLDVTYDGDPQFESIPGTGMEWGVNTASQVLRSGNRYWVVTEGVWYTGNSAQGPWEVATDRPEDVDDIPADNPNHNVKYVYVFDSTPEVVYVGYTPGYTSTYIYGGTVVYGTGYYYQPWYGAYYYPRPATWGFHLRYNPWTGWSFGVSYSRGPFTFGIGFGSWGRWHGGYWGMGGYHGYRRGYRRGYYHGARAGYRAGARAGYRRSNIYNNRPQARPVRTAQPRATTGTRDRSMNAPNAVSRTQQNNVFTDRDGNVMRRDASGDWQQRSGGEWQSQGRASAASDRSAQSRAGQQPTQRSGGNNLQSLERQSAARQRGTTRTNSYRSNRSGSSRSGGGRRRR